MASAYAWKHSVPAACSQAGHSSLENTFSRRASARVRQAGQDTSQRATSAMLELKKLCTSVSADDRAACTRRRPATCGLLRTSSMSQQVAAITRKSRNSALLRTVPHWTTTVHNSRATSSTALCWCARPRLEHSDAAASARDLAAALGPNCEEVITFIRSRFSCPGLGYVRT